MLDSESNKWIDAMNAEIQSMMDNMVWVLVDLPPGCKTVGSRWLFKKKTDMDGIRHTRFMRLLAKWDVKKQPLKWLPDEGIYLVQPVRCSTPNEVNRMKNVPYASAVGSIMYAVRCTRPDVAFAQNMTSRFQQNPELRVESYCYAGFETDQKMTLKSRQDMFSFRIEDSAAVILAMNGSSRMAPDTIKDDFHYGDFIRALSGWFMPHDGWTLVVNIVAQRRLEDKQPEEKTNTDCLVKEREKVHLGIKVGANITVTGVPGQEGAEGNVAEKKKGVYES
ncbi:hypothetical protein Tco_0774254 [Tanacetum coccineum]|uniref:Reverse transcriptase Ty1/copia-type domain-containing protein n=1 Tax=Tanacetum coccineum TaxID=301880 RepID=A0ABQ4ZMZ8_9ASTR